jgi:hypothetical protein
VVRWRCIDLQQLILARWHVAYHESTVGKLIRRLGFRHISARPRHLGQDPAEIEAFKKLPRSSGRDRPEACAWHADRSLVPGRDAARPEEQDHSARRGTRPRALADLRTQSAYLFGAICPERGAGAAVVMPHANSAAM